MEVNEQISAGKELAAQSRCVVCALARDNEENLSITLHQLEELSTYFAEFAVVIYENDSEDLTADILHKWNPAFEKNIISEKLDISKFGSVMTRRRAAGMAECRNKYLQMVKDTYSAWDFCIVFDIDLEEWTTDGIMHSLGESSVQWDAITANGLQTYKGDTIYYDTWVLIVDGEPRLGRIIASHSIELDFPLRVTSAFGGLAVYKMVALLPESVEYGAEFYRGRWFPDHVHLCFSMAENGFDKLYMNPQMIVWRTK